MPPSDGLCENAAGLRGVADLTMTQPGRKLLAPKVCAVDEFDVSDDGALKEHACFGDRSPAVVSARKSIAQWRRIGRLMFGTLGSRLP